MGLAASAHKEKRMKKENLKKTNKGKYGHPRSVFLPTFHEWGWGSQNEWMIFVL
jgi:hypothetical protein